MTVVRFAINVELAGASPRQVGERFLTALKASVVAAQLAGRIDPEIVEEIFRAMPELRSA